MGERKTENRAHLSTKMVVILSAVMRVPYRRMKGIMFVHSKMGHSKPVSWFEIDVISSLSTRSYLQQLNCDSKHFINCFYRHAECQYTECH